MEVTVKATKPGFDGTKRRSEGEVFTIDDLYLKKSIDSEMN